MIKKDSNKLTLNNITQNVTWADYFMCFYNTQYIHVFFFYLHGKHFASCEYYTVVIFVRECTMTMKIPNPTHEFTPIFFLGGGEGGASFCSIFSFMGSVLLLIVCAFVLFGHWLYCLHFTNLRLLITPLIFSTLSFDNYIYIFHVKKKCQFSTCRIEFYIRHVTEKTNVLTRL